MPKQGAPGPFDKPLEMSTEGLLMEVMRQIDEMRRLGGELPPLSAQIAVAMPLIPPLRELSPEKLDLLQLVFNYGHVETILNKSKKDDVTTSELLVQLIRDGYVRKE
jgi:hypothetical protein